MATQIFSRVVPKTRSLFSRSLSTSSTTTPATSFLRRYRPLSALSFLPAIPSSGRSLSTRATTSSLNDPNPNWSNRPPKETILLDGCDFEHWLVVMEKPEENATRDDIIDGYIKTLAQVVGSEQEARMKIYSVSTRHYFAFGALVSEELSYKLKELPKVRWVLPDSYLNVREKDYGGEPFINGEAVPYDPKYHEEWVRNNARANERNRRNDRPRDRPRRTDVGNRNNQTRPPMQNAGGPPTDQGGFPPNNASGHAYPRPGNMGGPPPSNPGGYPPNNQAGPYLPRPGNMGGPSPRNPGGYPNNQAGGYPPNNQAAPYPPRPGNIGGPPPSNPGGYPPNYQAAPYPPRPGNIGGPPPSNSRGFPPNNEASGYHPNNQAGPYPSNNMGDAPPNSAYGPNAGYPPNQNNYAGNMEGVPPNQNMGGYSQNAGWSNNAPTRDTPSRDFEGAVGGNTYNG